VTIASSPFETDLSKVSSQLNIEKQRNNVKEVYQGAASQEKVYGPTSTASVFPIGVTRPASLVVENKQYTPYKGEAELAIGYSKVTVRSPPPAFHI